MSLLSHSWKSSVRSILWGRELGANIFIGIILAMLALNFLGIGLALRSVLRDAYPDKDPVELLNRSLFFFFCADLVFRMLLQKVPSVEVRSYLLLPIRKVRIVRFILFRMLLSGFNIVPLFAVIPLSFTLLLPERDAIAAFQWLVAVLSTILVVNVLVFLVDKIVSKKTLAVPFVSCAVFSVLLLDYVNLISLGDLSAAFFGAFVSHATAAIAWLVGAVLVFEGSARMISDRFTLDVLTESRKGARRIEDSWVISRLEGKSRAASFIALELRLFMRNGRARASLSLAAIVILFVPLYYILMAPKILLRYAPPPIHEVREELEARTLPEERMIELVVYNSALPPDAWVFVTGNQSMLGTWKPAHVPMHRVNDSTWTRSFPLIAGTELRYIFTLGTWKSEAVTADLEADVHAWTVTDDTTIVHPSPTWRDAGLDGFETIMILYMALLLVAMPMLVYGQFVFVWESNYFDLLLSTPIATPTYLRSKFFLLLILGGCGLMLGIPTYWISEELLPIHLYAGLYNLGVNSLLLLFWATLSKKRMDLAASIFSTQGKGSTNFMTIIPTMILPILIVLLARTIPGMGDGMPSLAVFGILGLLFSTSFLTLAEKVFDTRKYAMRAGFRAS